MTREEAEKMGAKPVARKTRAEAEAAGAVPAPNQEPIAEPGLMDRIKDSLTNNPGTEPAQMVTRRLDYAQPSAPKAGPGEVPYWLVPPEEAERARAFASGGSLGLMPHAVAAVEGTDPQTEQQRYSEASEKHPLEHLAGNLAVPTPMGKAGVLPRIVGTGILTGVQGAAEAKPGERMEGAAFGGGSGMLGAGVGEGIGAIAGKLAPNRYMKAAGFIQKDLQKRSLPPERQAELSKWLETSGVVPPGAGKGTILERLQEKLGESGQRIGAERTGLDAARTPLDWDAVEASVKQHLDSLDPLARRHVAPEFEDVLNAIKEAKTKGHGYESLGAMKGTAQSLSDYDRNKTTVSNDARMAIARMLRQQEEQQISANAPGVSQSLQPAFKEYRNAASVLPATKSALAREKGNDPLGLVGKGMVGLGLAGAGYDAMTGGHHHEASVPAIAAGAGLALANRRGSALAAPLLATARNQAPAIGRTFAQWLEQQTEDAKDRLKNDR